MIRSSTTNPDVQLRFTDKEHFFHDLAQLLRSGIPLQRAIEHIGAGRDRAANTSRVLSPLISGGVASAFAAAGFATLDVEILEAGEQSGRMEMACFRLSQYYGRLAAGRYAPDGLGVQVPLHPGGSGGGRTGWKAAGGRV